MRLFSFRDVTSSFRVYIEVAQTEIEYKYLLLRKAVDFVFLLVSNALLQQVALIILLELDRFEDEIFGFHIAMDHPAIVNLFEAGELHYTSSNIITENLRVSTDLPFGL